MAASCSITCNVKDRNGKVKVSALWDELSKIFKGDRADTVTHYFLTKDSRFLSENSDILEFDTDGEVTIASLKKAMERDGEYYNLSNKRILGRLNEEIKAGKYDYSEALDNVLKFNRSNQFREGFMATLKRNDDGTYEVSVVERNPSEEYELSNHVMNKILTDSIRRILLDRGLSVEFLDNPKYAIKFSTNNVHLDADGFMSIAQVINGVNSSSAIAEAAGHFLVGAMDGNPLLERLIAQLTPEVQMAIFKDQKSEFYRPDFSVNDFSAREAAGILIGNSLISPIKNQMTKTEKTVKVITNIPKSIKYILSKIGPFVKSLFGKDTPEGINVLVQRAKDAAATAAQGFISNPDIADTNNALANGVTYTHHSVSEHLAKGVKRNVEAFYETLGTLKDTLVRLKSSIGRTDNPLNRDIFKKLEIITNGISSAYAPQMGINTYANSASIEGMVVAIESVIQVLDTDVRSLLDSIQPADRAGAYSNMASNAHSMRTLNTVIKNICQLYDTLSSQLTDLSANERAQFKDNNENQVTETLREAVKRLGDILIGNEETYIDTEGNEQIVHGLSALMENKRRQLFIDAIRDFYGENFINMNFGKVWQQKSRFKYSLVSKKRTAQVSDFVRSLDEDISWFDRYLSSAADCGDFITAVGNKVTKQANMVADRLTSDFWDELETIRIQMNDLFGNTDCRPFYEVIEDSEGHRTLTGNLISEVNYGAWEKARKEFKEQLKKDFYNYLADLRQKAYENNKNVPGYVFELTDEQKGVLYHNFVDPQWKRWHEEHSEDSSSAFGGKKKVPNKVKYHNAQYDALFDTNDPTLTSEERERRKKQRALYESLLALKRRMDSMLPKNSTVDYRAPQFTGRFQHRFRNLKAKFGSNNAAFGRAVRRTVQDNFVIRPDEAWMFGSNNEYNEIEEDPFENPLYFEKEKINRLPLFGVNKLKDMEDLSTDLFGSLLQYASMAATYKSMEQVVDIFELGKDVLKQRKVGNKIDKDREETSKAYERYIKFVDKSVYGLGVTPPSWDRRKVITKFASKLSSLGGKILLAGNVPGGIVNTGTGVTEILKEAMAGENFSMSECAKANKMYFDGLLTTDGYFGTFLNGMANAQRPEDKNSLWIRHWNILSENKSFFRNQKFDTEGMHVLDGRLWDWFDHTLMLPYSSGDHYMQTIPYYAMGLHEKVYTRDGREISLMDAYEIVDGEEVFAYGNSPLLPGEVIGRTPKKLKLKEGIFRSVEDIDKYDKAKEIIERISNYFENHPNLKNTDVLPDGFLTSEDVEFLLKEKIMNVHMGENFNVKTLESINNVLNSKLGQYVYNQSDESAFMDKCRNICNRLHGIYNSEDKVAFQQNFYGNLVTSMRGYALGMINRRYAGNKFNVPQNKAVEGSYNTAFKVLVSGLMDFNNMDNWRAFSKAMLIMTPLSPFSPLMFNKKFSNQLKADMVKAGFSEHQYYNVRRTTADFMVLEALALLKLLASPGSHFGLNDDEDEDKSKKTDTSDNVAWGLLYYFTNRWFNEQGAFTWPPALWSEGNSLMDYVPVGFSGMKSILDIAILAAETQFDKIGNADLGNSEYYYQSSKDGKYEAGDEKWWIKTKRLIPYYRSWYTFTHPYDAASSYEYGRRVRGK